MNLLSILLYFDKPKPGYLQKISLLYTNSDFNLNKPEYDDFITVLPAALVTVTFTLSVSVAGTVQFIDLVLLLD